MEAGVWPLADEQVAAVGNGPQGGLKLAGVGEADRDRHDPVASAPEDEAGTANAVEIEGLASEESAGGGAGVGMDLVGGKEALDSGRRQGRRLGRPPAAEDEAPKPGRSRHETAGRRHQPPGTKESDGKDERASGQRTGTEGGCAGEHDPPDAIGPLGSQPEGDYPTQGVPHHDRGQHPLLLGKRPHDLGQGGQTGAGKRRGAAVAGEIGTENAAATSQNGRDLDPVPCRPSQPVHEHDRRPLPADEEAERKTPDRRSSLC